MTNSASTAAAPGPGTRPVGRRRTILLVASLAANLFLGGILVGGWVAGRGDGPPPGGPPGGFEPPSQPFRHLIAALTPEARGEARRIFGAHRADIRADFVALHQARLAVAEALTADPYSPAEVAAAFAELRRRTVEVQENIHGALAELAGRIGEDDRRRLVETGARLTGAALPGQRGGRPHWRDGDRGRPPPPPPPPPPEE